MEVNPSVPAVPEFIAYAKAKLRKDQHGICGDGSVQHVSGELFNMMTGVSMVHVPYRGGAPALTDLIGGQVQIMFDALTNSIEYIKVGKLRALAVTTATRSGTARPPDGRRFCAGLRDQFMERFGAPKNAST
jgi:tripartite-type tricarboxylate transporter receptor subunit TctC